MFFILLITFSLCASSICATCQDLVEKGINLVKKGKSLKSVNLTLMSECKKQTNFLLSAGCQSYVKSNIKQLYKQANSTKLTPFQVCLKNNACKEDDL